MSVLLGNNLIIYLDGTAIAGATSCTIDYDAETIEVSSPSTGTAKNYIVSRTGWKVTVSCLVDVVDTFMLNVGQSYTLTFGARSDTGDRMTGTAICTSAKVSGQKFNITSGSFEFQGTGALTNANYS